MLHLIQNDETLILMARNAEFDSDFLCNHKADIIKSCDSLYSFDISEAITLLFESLSPFFQ